MLPINSPRIASKGFYTDRPDIPHYQDNENKSKKPVINLPWNSDKVEIIEELKKDCFGEKENSEAYQGDAGEENFTKDEIYDYLIEKATGTAGTNQTTLLHIPNASRGSDARIRINTLNLNRLRGGINRNHF